MKSSHNKSCKKVRRIKKYCLQIKIPYIVKTELTKNRTHQSYRWKDYALSNNLKALIKIKSINDRIINYKTLEVLK